MKKILITSALPYINGVKHLGNLIGSQLPADVYARYKRAKGFEVLLICATDEHGTPAELAAKKENIDVELYCKKMWEKQSEIIKKFNLSFDHFGRSSSKQNHKLTQHFANKLYENGFIEERIEKQFFSKTDDRFLPDRYIEGICPSCNYERARGDQCENCTKQLNPVDLISPKSVISGDKDLVLKETLHLYLLQSKLQKEIKKWLEKKKEWPKLTISIAKKWLKEKNGLQDRGITRDLKWGIPVKKGKIAWPGLEKKVFYVWFDAPIEYIGATAEWAEKNKLKNDEWEKWWRLDKGADQVFYVQFMAKDNIPFHTLSFPATILGSKEPWKLANYIKGFNWLTYESGKFSTSEKRGVFMDQALSILDADYWRWWLLSNAPEGSDSDFTWESFQATINKDLSDVLGNFVSRLTKFSFSKFGNKIPLGMEYSNLENEKIKEINSIIEKYEKNLERIEIRKSAYYLRSIWVIGNEYLQKAEPWKHYKNDVQKASMIVRFGFNLLALYAYISEPFIPDTSEKIFKYLKLNSIKYWPKKNKPWDNIIPNQHTYDLPDNLFKKLSDKETSELKKQFQGS